MRTSRYSRSKLHASLSIFDHKVTFYPFLSYLNATVRIAVKRWTKGTDFTNNYNTVRFQYSGTLSATTSFRLKMYASRTSEYFHIHDFNIREYYLAKLPSCFDGVQNGDEEGVDCGGSSCEPCFFTGEYDCSETIEIPLEDNYDLIENGALYTDYIALDSRNDPKLEFKASLNLRTYNYSTSYRRATIRVYLNNVDIYSRVLTSTRTVQISLPLNLTSAPGNTVNYRFRIEASNFGFVVDHVEIDDFKLLQANCQEISFAPQWAGSRTLDSTLYRSGAVGIGIPDPGTYKLAVNGDIRAKKVRVEQEGWPDYVFTPDYQLPELPAIEQYIQQNGHLENIPSAEEVAAQGIDLGEMDKRLLEKIEQLTLLMIQMDKEVKALREENQALREENKTIKDRLKKLEH